MHRHRVMKPIHNGILEEMIKNPLIANISHREPQMAGGKNKCLIVFRTTHKWMTMPEKKGIDKKGVCIKK